MRWYNSASIPLVYVISFFFFSLFETEKKYILLRVCDVIFFFFIFVCATQKYICTNNASVQFCFETTHIDYILTRYDYLLIHYMIIFLYLMIMFFFCSVTKNLACVHVAFAQLFDFVYAHTTRAQLFFCSFFPFITLCELMILFLIILFIYIFYLPV